LAKVEPAEALAKVEPAEALAKVVQGLAPAEWGWVPAEQALGKACSSPPS
jgi:hypothetical protein